MYTIIDVYFYFAQGERDSGLLKAAVVEVTTSGAVMAATR
jgi:hypothetical protein